MGWAKLKTLVHEPPSLRRKCLKKEKWTTEGRGDSAISPDRKPHFQNLFNHGRKKKWRRRETVSLGTVRGTKTAGITGRLPLKTCRELKGTRKTTVNLGNGGFWEVCSRGANRRKRLRKWLDPARRRTPKGKARMTPVRALGKGKTVEVPRHGGERKEALKKRF